MSPGIRILKSGFGVRGLQKVRPGDLIVGERMTEEE